MTFAVLIFLQNSRSLTGIWNGYCMLNVTALVYEVWKLGDKYIYALQWSMAPTALISTKHKASELSYIEFHQLLENLN